LLQEDRLHPTRLGMALLGYSLQDPLRELFPADHALSKQKWTFAQFVEAAGRRGRAARPCRKPRSSLRGHPLRRIAEVELARGSAPLQ
jgi:hypothetical protein